MGGSDEQKYDHPTQKPVDLMRRPLLNHLKRGEAVYDPFLGSGTTLAAAELTKRASATASSWTPSTWMSW